MAKTHVLTAEAATSLREEAAQALRQGQVLLLPTETVYGIAVRGDDPALEARVRALKGRDADKPFQRLVPGLEAVVASGAALTRQARRLARRYWPGPLTLVLDGPGGATIGFRVPGHEFARQVVAAAGVPVIATSANQSGQPDAIDFAQAFEAVGRGVDLALDGGRAPLGAPSTVVRAPAAGGVQVLREGFLDAGPIERVANRLVVFVCTGNTCRSPMAEGLFRALLARRLGLPANDPATLAAQGWLVASAGIAAADGAPAAENARTVMTERGVDLSGHASRQLAEEVAERADLIITMSDGHLRTLIDWAPELAERTIVLDPRGVPDPIGSGLATYRATADHIAARLGPLVEDLVEADEAGRPLTAAFDPVVEDERPNGPTRAQPTPAPRTPMHDLSTLFPAPGEVPAQHDLGWFEDGDLYLIDGEVRRWKGETLPVKSVVCDRKDGALERREVGRSAALTSVESQDALAAATRAWDLGRGEWARASIGERVDRLQAFATAMRPQRELVSKLLMWEIGKSVEDATKEFDRTVEYIEATCEALRERERAGSRFRTEGGVIGRLRRAPFGVTLCMGPFNYPLNETYTLVIPALAMGNPVIVKLPKLGMLANLPLLRAFADCFPKGVVNVLHGDGAQLISPLMSSGKVDVLAFIGSCRVAGIIEKQHPAPYRLQTIYGLEAKNAAIVLPDADLDLAVKETVKGALSYNGQRCTGLKLIYVHRSKVETFLTRLSDAVEALPAGMPWRPGVKVTPLPEENKAHTLSRFIEDAVKKGGRVVNPSGGKHAGTLFFPAIVHPTPKDADLYHHEQFGPIVPVVPFDDVDEVHQAIAHSPFGQQVSVFGHDQRVIGPMLDALANQVCRVNLNAQCQRGPDRFPFGGRKSSAEGVLSVTDALDAFSIPSLVTATDDAKGRALMGDLLKSGSSRFLGRDAL